MDKYGVNTQKWRLAETPEQAKQAAIDLNCSEYVVKSQIHAGGRGKGEFDSGLKGGVHLSKDPEEVKRLSEKMLGYKLKTKQTPGAGVLVKKLMIAESLNFDRELYFAIVLDRANNGPVLVASPKGGMDIEQVAHDTPELIFKRKVNILKGIQPEDTLYIATKLGFHKNIEKAQLQITRLYEMFEKTDAVQVEINPFVEISNGDVYCVDAKINFDDNAAYRQKEIYAMRDTTEEDPREVEASKYNLNYIGMDGNVGCMVNGAGLAMATMDIIKLYNGEPANFLDVGGGATEAQVVEAFKILTSDPKVEVLLINIFGGIVKCDTIAAGIVNAAKQVKLTIPLIVRLEGTNVKLGYSLLEKSGLPIIIAHDLDEAAQKAVSQLKKK
jgi:succinyl-CoA synthetase beta subunit